MNTMGIITSDIINELFRIPDTSLDKVTTYVESLLMDTDAPIPKNQSLKGIWKDAGFEIIFDLKEELRDVRQQLQHSILKRTI